MVASNLNYIPLNGETLASINRNDPFFDSNGAPSGAVHPATLKFFVDVKNFSPALVQLGSSKEEGRDTNVTSALGMTSEGERFFVFGASSKADAPNVTLNSANGPVFVDLIRRMRGIGFWTWKCSTGNQKFLERPLRDLPMTSIRIVHYTQADAADGCAYQIDEPGMYNLMNEGKPYLIESKQESQVIWTFKASAALPTPGFEIVYQFQFEGRRVYGQLD
jgi:hypothetical protein